MKRILLFSFIATMLIGVETRACVDPVTVIKVHTNYDTVMVGSCPYANKLEVRLSNLRMMNESPNKICACAISSLADLFSNLNYVAFVDSGTNNPYPGFAEFVSGAEYDNAWDASQPGFGGWSGFIADVINEGLQADDPLEMIIRATAPAGTVISIDSGCTNSGVLAGKLDDSSLGTDAWDPVGRGGGLDESHQGVRAMEGSTFDAVDSAFFAALDDDILSNYPTDTNECEAAFSYEVDEDELEVTDLSNMDANQFVIVDWGDGTSDSIMSNSTITHTYTELETYTVCVDNVNNGVVECSACDDIEAGPNGINTISSSTGLSVYPNPAKDMLYVTINGEKAQGFNLQLINMLGKSVAASTTLSNGRIDVSDVPNGIYFVRTEKDGVEQISQATVIHR